MPLLQKVNLNNFIYTNFWYGGLFNSLSRVQLWRRHGLQPARHLWPWISQDFPRTLECVAISLLQGTFPPQESNPGLLHCRQILHQLSYEGSLTFDTLWHFCSFTHCLLRSLFSLPLCTLFLFLPRPLPIFLLLILLPLLLLSPFPSLTCRASFIS